MDMLAASVEITVRLVIVKRPVRAVCFPGCGMMCCPITSEPVTSTTMVAIRIRMAEMIHFRIQDAS
jgi:hypothetical protein